MCKKVTMLIFFYELIKGCIDIHQNQFYSSFYLNLHMSTS